MADDDGVDCSAVVEEMFIFLDGELTENRRAQISRHMGDCSNCHEVIEFHAELKVAIAKGCREQVPAELRARIEKALGFGGR